jgi:hypothetical protein
MKCQTLTEDLERKATPAEITEAIGQKFCKKHLRVLRVERQVLADD